MLPAPSTTLPLEPHSPRDHISPPKPIRLKTLRPCLPAPLGVPETSIMCAATPNAGKRCAASTVRDTVRDTVSTHEEPDLERAMEPAMALIAAGRPLDRLSADALKLGYSAMHLDRPSASPVIGTCEIPWEYPPQPEDPPSGDPEAVLRKHAKTCLPTMSPDSLRLVPRLPTFRHTLPESHVPPDSVHTTDVVGGLVRQKVCCKEYTPGQTSFTPSSMSSAASTMAWKYTRLACGLTVPSCMSPAQPPRTRMNTSSTGARRNPNHPPGRPASHRGRSTYPPFATEIPRRGSPMSGSSSGSRAPGRTTPEQNQSSKAQAP